VTDPVDAVLSRHRAEELRAAVDRRDAGAALRALDALPDDATVRVELVGGVVAVAQRILEGWDAGQATDNILTPDLVHELRVHVQRSTSEVAELTRVLDQVLRLGHIQDDGPSLCQCATHRLARRMLL
jgi:alkanesulfonate monooxygenase SsuD/methylene tetrahydromethanopterin reductase-like flavin-dependent oxidoreductase (luciferase family)